MSRVTRSRAAGARNGEWGALVAWIVGAEAAGGLGALMARPGAWYAALDKPSAAPSTWLLTFGWSGCYFLLAIAIWLVWRERARTAVRLEVAVTGLMLGLPVLWDICLFGARRPDLAGLMAAMLWILTLFALWRFGRIRRPTTLLLAPVLGWVSYVGAITIGIWLRNG